MQALKHNELLENEKKVELLAPFLSYTKYVSDYCMENGLPDYVKKFSSSVALRNIVGLDADGIEWYVDFFNNHLVIDYQLGADNSLPDFMSYDEFNTVPSKSSEYLNEDAVRTLIAEQSFFNTIKNVQASESEKNALDGDNPSVFVFIKYDHRGNLFTYHGEVDKDNPELIRGIDGISTIFDIDEREEVAFIIKEGFYGLLEMRTGNYNEFVTSPVLDELKGSLSNENSPLYPYFLKLGVGEDSFDKYECTRNMCVEFLSPDSNSLSSLQLVELETDELQPFLSEHYKDIRLFCDAKDETVLYTFEGDDVLHRYVDELRSDTLVDFAYLVEMSPLEAVPNRRNYEIVESDSDISVRHVKQKEVVAKRAIEGKRRQELSPPTLGM